MLNPEDIAKFLVNTPNKGTFARLEEEFGLDRQDAGKVIKEARIVVIAGKWYYED